jgi:hypothetical protein
MDFKVDCGLEGLKPFSIITNLPGRRPGRLLILAQFFYNPLIVVAAHHYEIDAGHHTTQIDLNRCSVEVV